MFKHLAMLSKMESRQDTLRDLILLNAGNRRSLCLSALSSSEKTFLRANDKLIIAQQPHAILI